MGAGSQATTYVARDERNEKRIVVLKQFALDKKDNWKSFDLFEREVRVLERLRHRGIPRYIDSFESEPGVFNLVIEKKPGVTLRTLAKKVRFADHELRDILARTLEILDHIHRIDPPIIHRDIKPANLLRDAKGNISLVDFGGVRDVLRTSGGSTIVGTFGYMAPEQLHGQATPATDIYGLGATMVALAGKVEPEDVPRKGLRMDLEAHLDDRDPALIRVLQAMTEPDPDQRPQDARAVISMLAKARPEKALVRAKQAALAKAGGSGADAAEADRKALARVKRSMAIRNSFADVGEFLEDVPKPLSYVLRIFLFTFALTGYLGLAVTQLVFLPVIFAIIGAFTSDETDRRLDTTRTDIDHALDDGRAGFRGLARRCLRSPDDDDSDSDRERKRLRS